MKEEKMKSLRKFICTYWMTLAISFVFILSITISCTKNENKELKIGAILPLTGDSAQWGIPPSKGAEIAADEINENDFLEGKKLKILFEDTKCDPKEGVAGFNKLISVHGVKIVLGGVCSSVTLAVAPIAEKNKILLISPASTNPKITDAGDYIFRIIPSDELRGKVFATYLFNKGYRKVGIIYINNEGGKGNRDSFKNAFQNLNGQIIIEDTYDAGTTDIRSQLTKIKNTSIEALVIVSYPSDTIILLKQAKELGITVPLYFQTEAVEDPNVLREAGSSAEGVIYILPAPAEGEIPNEFVKKYQKRYGIKPELFAAEAYDIIWLIAKAIRDTKKVDSNSIKKYFYTIKNYQGASGIITFDNNGDVLKPMAIKTIKNGNPLLLEVVSYGQ